MKNRWMFVVVLMLSLITVTESFGDVKAEKVEESKSTESGEVRTPIFRLGPTLGLGLSTVLCDSCESMGIQSRAGLSTGSTFEILIGKYMSIETEVMYLQKGALLRRAGTTSYINYNTIEFPVSFKGRFGNEKVKGVVFSGPQIGFAVTQTITSGGQTQNLPSSDTDIGVHVGGGVEFQFSRVVSMFVTGRFNIGLKNLDVGILNESATSFGFLSVSGIKFGL